jgi:CheY-like chemotaxis protein
MMTNSHAPETFALLHSNNALKGIIIIGMCFSSGGLITSISGNDLLAIVFFITLIAGHSLSFFLYRKGAALASLLLALSITVVAALGSAATGFSDMSITMLVVPAVIFYSSIRFTFRIYALFTGITVIALNSVMLFFPAAQSGLSIDLKGFMFVNSIILSVAVIGRMLSVDLVRTYQPTHSGHPAAEPRSVKGTILIVDDNETILHILEKSLAAEGYKIFPFSSAVALSQWLEGTPASFDLLITDYFLNESDGRIVIEQVRKLLPSVPIILISGYPLNKLSFDSDYYRNVVFLQKPFSSQEMVTTVEHILR